MPDRITKASVRHLLAMYAQRVGTPSDGPGSLSIDCYRPDPRKGSRCRIAEASPDGGETERHYGARRFSPRELYYQLDAMIRALDHAAEMPEPSENVAYYYNRDTAYPRQHWHRAIEESAAFWPTFRRHYASGFNPEPYDYAEREGRRFRDDVLSAIGWNRER